MLAEEEAMTAQQTLDCLALTARRRAEVFDENHESVVEAVGMYSAVATLKRDREELARALRDVLSTLGTEDGEVLISSERRETWEDVLKRCAPKEGGDAV